jgi:Sulfatase-modifying factor enzyme 1
VYPQVKKNRRESASTIPERTGAAGNLSARGKMALEHLGNPICVFDILTRLPPIWVPIAFVSIYASRIMYLVSSCRLLGIYFVASGFCVSCGGASVTSAPKDAAKATTKGSPLVIAESSDTLVVPDNKVPSKPRRRHSKSASPLAAADTPPETLVAVPKGIIRQGCLVARGATCLGREVPKFEIRRGFVTVAEYARCAAAGQCPQVDTTHPANAPMVHTTRGEAKAFCASQGLRLPDETEWERAFEEGAIAPIENGPAEWLLGWYTFFGPGFRGEDIGVKGISNSPLIIQLHDADSYRFGGPDDGWVGLRSQAFRCVRGPEPRVQKVMCKWTGRVECLRE